MKRETRIDGHMTLLDSCTIANATSEMNDLSKVVLRTKTTIQMSNALAASLGREHVELSFTVPWVSLLQTIFRSYKVSRRAARSVCKIFVNNVSGRSTIR
jgi:hypothetical protein